MKRLIFIASISSLFVACQKPDPVKPYTPPTGKPTLYVGVKIGDTEWAKGNVNASGWLGEPCYNGMLYRWNQNIAWLYFDLTAGTIPNSSVPGGIVWDNVFVATGSEWQEANNPCPVGYTIPTKVDWESMFALTTYSWRNAISAELYEPHIEITYNTGTYDNSVPPKEIINHLYIPATEYRNEAGATMGASKDIIRLWTSDGYIVEITRNPNNISYVSKDGSALPIRCIKK